MSISHKGRKLLWSAPIRSVKKLERTFDKDDCLQIPRNKALFMSDSVQDPDNDCESFQFQMADLNLYISIEIYPHEGEVRHSTN
eukprot:TRINITY_DN6083_c0_g1_i1.p1 TRINITY_DN6083_c0_g1~~TRINITY_DN6083_c0_g1_i1.p1  ORF type:complete len:94 (+),score=2.65 TRINITY_DN6083_c0_g1_i1:33-284(+)